MKTPVRASGHYSAKRPSNQPPKQAAPPEPRPVPASNRPLVLDLPGLDGREWEDSELLWFIAETLSDSRQTLLQVPSLRVGDRMLAELAEVLVMAGHLAAWEGIVLNTPEIDNGIDAALQMRGLASPRGWTTREVLERFAWFLYSNRRAIWDEALPRMEAEERLRLAECLAVAEAIEEREGTKTDLEDANGEPTECVRRACAIKAEIHLDTILAMGKRGAK